MKVAVFAGTWIDTQMGADLLEGQGYQVFTYPMAQNPKEQTQLQYYSKDELEGQVASKIQEAKKHGIQAVFIYCNSLSSAIDCEKLARKTSLPIITPLKSYQSLPEGSKNVAILAANGISAFKIDQIVRNYHPAIQTQTFGHLRLVELIEKQLPAQEIVSRLNLKGWLHYLENIGSKEQKIDYIILACTHFPYIKHALAKHTTIPFIDPTADMLNELDLYKK